MFFIRTKLCSYVYVTIYVKVFTRSKPFTGITDEMELAYMLHDGEGLDIDKLPPEVAGSVRDMIMVQKLKLFVYVLMED